MTEEYEFVVLNWPKLGLQSQPPTLQQWLGARTIVHRGWALADGSLDDLRVFNAIERLVTNLRQNNVVLAHLDDDGEKLAVSCEALAGMLVQDFKLPPGYAKRFQELFAYYLKSLAEIVDAEKLGLTDTAREILLETFDRLLVRSRDAGGDHDALMERTIGRIEGAAALLVRANVMSREKAEHETEAFKKLVRAGGKK